MAVAKAAVTAALPNAAGKAASRAGTNKALVLGVATVGGVMLYAGLTGKSVMDVLAGKASLKGSDPAGGKHLSLSDLKGIVSDVTASGKTLVPLGKIGTISGSPKDIIDNVVVPLAQKHSMQTGNSPGAVLAANQRHGPTVTGGRSDHQGPPDQAWAADMSNGQSPTPQMDALAADIARTFGIKWSGSGAVSHTANGFRYQLIYRSIVGGNHYNHVHFGIRKA